MRRLHRVLTLLASFAGAALLASGASALAIEEKPAAPGQVGVPYSYTFSLEEGSGTEPITWSIDSGALPPGLSLQGGTKRSVVVSGTPTQAGSFSFFLKARDGFAGPSVCCTERQFTINISGRLIVSTSSLPDAGINQPYSLQLQASGGSVSSWSLASGTLPDGLTLSPGGVLAGTPTKSGTFTFTVQANGSPNNDTKQLSIFVLAPLVLGGPGARTFAAEPVPVNAKVNTPFVWGVVATGGKPGYTYTSTTLPAGLTLNADGTITGTPTTAGSSTVTFTVTDALGATDTLQVKLTIKALLAFAKAKTPPRGVVGSQYRWQVPVTGASKTRIFLMSGTFPPGLELDEATGILFGTPLAKGRFKIKVWVLGDPGTIISKRFSVRIA